MSQPSTRRDSLALDLMTVDPADIRGAKATLIAGEVAHGA